MARYTFPDGRVVQSGSPFEHDGILYPLNWFQHATPDEKAALGVTEVVEQPRPDERYGWVNDDTSTPGAYIFTPFSKEVMQERLMAYAASKRWARETSGIKLGEMSIPTDERTQGVLTGARAKVIADPTYAVPDWKAGPGTYITLDAATITAISDAVAAHVQACFTLNKAVDEAILAGTVTTYEAVDEMFAPVEPPVEPPA